ncbi:hypothetical protein [Streptomyces sp. NPDC002769]|uniref:hypothetical protein n=1 Tax=Streptomyces sp. NPDC002769 TaxID=3154542 RepID=UPI00332F7241
MGLPLSPDRAGDHRQVRAGAAPQQEAEAAVQDACREPISPCGPRGRVRERVEAFLRAAADMLDVIPAGVRYRAGRPRPSGAGSRKGHA